MSEFPRHESIDASTSAEPVGVVVEGLTGPLSTDGRDSRARTGRGPGTVPGSATKGHPVVAKRTRAVPATARPSICSHVGGRPVTTPGVPAVPPSTLGYSVMTTFQVAFRWGHPAR
jgi:hypothetical protein